MTAYVCTRCRGKREGGGGDANEREGERRGTRNRGASGPLNTRACANRSYEEGRVDDAGTCWRDPWEQLRTPTAAAATRHKRLR